MPDPVPGAISFDKAKALGADLGETLAHADAIRSDVFEHWIGDDAERKSFLDGTVWGTIRWATVLGRPDGDLSSAFDVVHSAYWETFVVTANGVLEYKTWMVLQDVVLFDRAAPGPNEYAVGYSFRAQALALPFTGDNRVEVRFGRQGPWPTPLETPSGKPAHLTIRPYMQSFNFSGGVVVLDDVVVE